MDGDAEKKEVKKIWTRTIEKTTTAARMIEETVAAACSIKETLNPNPWRARGVFIAT